MAPMGLTSKVDKAPSARMPDNALDIKKMIPDISMIFLSILIRTRISKRMIKYYLIPPTLLYWKKQYNFHTKRQPRVLTFVVVAFYK
jgi:hypothetical protein